MCVLGKVISKKIYLDGQYLVKIIILLVYFGLFKALIQNGTQHRFPERPNKMCAVDTLLTDRLPCKNL